MPKEILEPDYKNMKTPLPHPGKMLAECFLRPRGITQLDFGRHTGIDPCVVSSMVNGRRTVTMYMAFKFAAALNTTPEMWLNAQMLHKLTAAYITKRDKKIAGHIKVIQPKKALAPTGAAK